MSSTNDNISNNGATSGAGGVSVSTTATNSATASTTVNLDHDTISGNTGSSAGAGVTTSNTAASSGTATTNVNVTHTSITGNTGGVAIGVTNTNTAGGTAATTTVDTSRGCHAGWQHRVLPWSEPDQRDEQRSGRSNQPGDREQDATPVGPQARSGSLSRAAAPQSSFPERNRP